MECYISEKELWLPASTQMALQSTLWKKKASKVGYALDRQMYIFYYGHSILLRMKHSPIYRVRISIYVVKLEHSWE